MGYIQFFDVFSAGIEAPITKSRGDACFASVFNMGVKNLLHDGDKTLKIYQLKDYAQCPQEGVTNAFSDEDRSLYLSLVSDITGIQLIEEGSSTIEYKRHNGVVMLEANVISTQIHEASSYIQFKAAITATRYVIEAPYKGILKIALDKYKEGSQEDFFELLQDAHYKHPKSDVGAHSWMPPCYFWGLLKASTYRKWLKDPGNKNGFGEVFSTHQKIFTDTHMELSKIAAKLLAKEAKNGLLVSEDKIARDQRALPFEQYVSI